MIPENDTIVEIMHGSFLVIKVPNQIGNDRERYVCIPSTWVKVEDDEDTVFNYPLEDELHTQLRVIEYQPRDKTWPTLHGNVVFDTDSQDAASRFVERKMDELKRDRDQTQNSFRGEQDDKAGEQITRPKQITLNLLKPSNKTSHPSKQQKPDQENILQRTTLCNEMGKEVDFEISEAHEIIRTYTRVLECGDPELSSTPKISHDTQVPDATKILPNETDDETKEETPINKENAKKVIERPRRKSTCQFKNYCEFSDDEFDSSPSNSSSDSDCGPIIVDPDSNVGILSSSQPRTSGESTPVGVNNSLDHQVITLDLLDDPVHSYLYNFYVDINESYQKTMSSFDNAADYLHKIITARKENVKSKPNQSSPSSTDTETMNTMIFSHPQPLLQERVSDEDTKWTLKYPVQEPGTIELLPKTGVYVSEEGLNACKSIAEQASKKKTNKLTRSLLHEVFKDEALKRCAFAGRKGLKPGIDLNARRTLVNYVLQYSLAKRWENANVKGITNCIRNKLTRSNRN